MERERFAPPKCTDARRDFYQCQLSFLQCTIVRPEICDEESGSCIPPIIDCICEPNPECGNSLEDNRFVDECEIENQANCELQCEGEAQLAACQLTGRCFTDELLTACGNCANNFELYFECLIENEDCPLDPATP